MKKISFTFCNILEWLHSVLIFSGLYFIFAVLLNLNDQECFFYILNCLWLLLPVIVSWYLIRKVKTFFSYLLLSALCMIILAFINPHTLTTILGILIFCIRCYVRIVQRRLKKMEKEMPGNYIPDIERNLWDIPTLLDSPSYIHLFLLFLFYLILTAMKQINLLFPLFCLCIIEFFICFIHQYLSGMAAFIKAKRQIANLPLKTFKQTGKGLLIALCCILFVAIVPSILYGQEPLTNLHFSRSIENTYLEEPTAMETMGSSYNIAELFTNEPAFEPPEWLSTALDLIVYFIFIVIVLLGIRSLFRLIKNMTETFSFSDEDEIISLSPEKEENVEKLPFLPSFFRKKNRTPDHAIRFYYKKMIIKRSKPVGFESPSELEEYSKLNLTEHAEEIHTYYEKARYSQHQCTKEEADHYRHLS